MPSGIDADTQQQKTDLSALNNTKVKKQILLLKYYICCTNKKEDNNFKLTNRLSLIVIHTIREKS